MLVNIHSTNVFQFFLPLLLSLIFDLICMIRFSLVPRLTIIINEIIYAKITPKATSNSRILVIPSFVKQKIALIGADVFGVVDNTDVGVIEVKPSFEVTVVAVGRIMTKLKGAVMVDCSIKVIHQIIRLRLWIFIL